jgi:maltose O-acetyltransferase
LLGAPTLELYFPLYISSPANLELGNRVAISAFVHILCNQKVRIGDDTIIASSVQITTSTHDYRVRPFRDVRRDAPVDIGSNVWIGAGAIILPGVRIGDNCVIGAGSVVTRNVAPDTVVAGVPARPIRDLRAEAVGKTA